MYMRKLTSLVLMFQMTISTLAIASLPVSHPSPEFTVHEPSGRQISLSGLKGKVVILEFFFIQSDHCMRVAKTLNKLNAELGPRGFQAIGIVFDPPRVADSEGKLVPLMVNYFKLTYPVGFATRAEVDTYLGRSGAEMLSIPQVVVIDRSGTIRAVTGSKADPRLEDESSLRSLVDSLLKETPPPENSPAKPASASPVRKSAR
jgi:peroxiredoxin